MACMYGEPYGYIGPEQVPGGGGGVGGEGVSAE